MRYNDEYRPGSGSFMLMPPAIKFILLATVGIFLLKFTILDDYLMYYGALWSFEDPRFQLWQPVSYLFLHGGLGHIFFNMLALWMFGMEIENYWGTRQFTIYYFTCGVGAALINLIATYGSGTPTVGASGAVYGVLLAFGMMFPERYIYLYFLLPIKAKYFVMIYIAFEFIGTFNTNSTVAHFAHLGGMIVGYIYIKVMQGEFPLQNWIERTFAESTLSSNKQSTRDIKRAQQERVDEILDKISRTGYESLSAEEKKILLDASKDDRS
ncbi:MAG: rhomboid family intramembrane serine protease [Chloroherpetonaceae bacterium]|nr:rhomboid family intramembrane serine protease [Chloroherpetonaceae bacterium]